MSTESILFVTGRLAAPALREVVESLSGEHGFSYQIEILPITVAALMTTDWVAKKLNPVQPYSRIILPGYCHGPLDPLSALTGCEVERGPSDFRRLPEYFGGRATRDEDYGKYDIEIIAEINHAPDLSVADTVQQAERLIEAGADLIDLGSIPNHDWTTVDHYVHALRDRGWRVSIDSLMPREIERAVKAGAELVLSVNRSNRDAAVDWGCEVVVIPDRPDDLPSLDETVDFLATRGVPLRIDPILEPIGCGFAASLVRYAATRARFPDAELMMGIGNLTELTDADSAGINVLLLGFCQELGIRSVLTTQVINWAQSSVRECDLARRLVRESVRRNAPPKHIEPDLILLRDERLVSMGESELHRLAAEIKDSNYRIYADAGKLHLLGAGEILSGDDPFELFDALAKTAPKNLDASHSFYLGFELCKALTALTLGKNYTQDEALDWGFLTRPEHDRQRLKRSRSSRQSKPLDDQTGSS